MNTQAALANRRTFLCGTGVTLLVFQLKGWLTNRNLEALVLFVAIYLFVFAFAKSVVQWHVWSLDPLSQNLLPPYNPDYFYGYAFNRFFLFPLVTLASTALFLGMMFLLRYQFGETALSIQEILLAVLASLLVGFPKIILLVVMLFVLMAIGTFFKKVFPVFRSRFFLGEKLFTSSLAIAFFTLLVFGNPMVVIFGLHVMKV